LVKTQNDQEKKSKTHINALSMVMK